MVIWLKLEQDIVDVDEWGACGRREAIVLVQ